MVNELNFLLTMFVILILRLTKIVDLLTKLVHILLTLGPYGVTVTTAKDLPMHTLTVTDVYKLPLAPKAALHAFCDSLVGIRATNLDCTCVATVTLVECETELRGIPALTKNGIELFIPGSDATLRVDFNGILTLAFEVVY